MIAVAKIASATVVAAQAVLSTPAEPVAPSALPQGDLACMARNIWFEARDGDAIEKAAVAGVVLNRVEDARFPGDVCGVVHQRAQFSWTIDGKSDRVVLANAIDRKAWRQTLTVATAALKGSLPDVTFGATHYHAHYVDPHWAPAMTATAEVGRHLFYKDTITPKLRPARFVPRHKPATGRDI